MAMLEWPGVNPQLWARGQNAASPIPRCVEHGQRAPRSARPSGDGPLNSEEKDGPTPETRGREDHSYGGDDAHGSEYHK